MDQQEMEANIKILKKFAFGNGEPGADEIIREHARILVQFKEEEIADKVKTVWAWMKDQREREKMRTAALYAAAFSGMFNAIGFFILLMMKVV